MGRGAKPEWKEQAQPRTVCRAVPQGWEASASVKALPLVLPQKSWNPWAAAAVSLSFLSVADGQVAGLGLDSTLNLEATPCPVHESARGWGGTHVRECVVV